MRGTAGHAPPHTPFALTTARATRAELGSRPITSKLESLSAHVVVAGERRGMLSDIRRRVEGRFGISHLTIQVEPEGFDDCDGCAHESGG